MSDSDSELLTNNRVFSFQNESTTVSARGPNISTSNLTGLSFRNNVLTSTLNMPRNYEWQRRAESNYDQRSMGYRRETSPASIASACDAKQRNFNRSYYPRGMSSQRSMFNGRSGSPMSMRSIDSNATMCATDIVTALNNTQFNKYDMRMIREAYNKLMKQKSRKRIEKRRNLKLFLKGYRRKSGYDSGELGSNSSMSSDDNRSTRTLNYKNNRSSCRSTKTDVADFRRTIKESNMFNDCTDNIKQNRVHGTVGRPANMNSSRSSVSLFMSMNEMPSSMNHPVNYNKTQSQTSMILQDRFKNGFLLPSQRFNKSVAGSSIPEAAEKPHHSQRNRHQNAKASRRDPEGTQELVSDDEEIFSEITAIERPAVNQRKRSFDSDDDICLPNQKKPKVASPCKNMLQSFKNSTVIEKAKKDFEFAKPAFPVRKSANSKAKEQIISISTDLNTSEQLISKSKAPITNSIILPPKQVNSTLPKEVEKEKEDISEASISQDTTDISMRPSFIKRKLFTQKMDVTENSNDILAANSPQNSVYGAIQKEKNKARKLVTSQYCLSRDIQTDEDNLLDLIHKIVPAEIMNATNQTNKTVQSKSEDNDDKWDVTSIISTRNYDENVSDTFTDEDTVHADDGNPQPSPKAAVKQAKTSPTKPSLNTENKKYATNITQLTKKVLVEKNGSPKAMVQKYVKTFWDTDFESDVEGAPETRQEDFKENNRSGNITQNIDKVKYHGFSSMFPASKTSLASNASMVNNTVDSVQRLNNTNRNLRLCSHRNNKPNVKKTVQDIKDDAKCFIEPQSKKPKPTKDGDLENEQNNKHENSKQEKSKLVIEKLKLNKETPEKAKEKEPLKKQRSKEKIQKSDEKVKPQNKRLKKTDANQSKLEKKLKTNKETPETNKEKEQLKKQNSKEKIQKSDEEVKPQNNRLKKTDANQSELEKKLKTNKETPENNKEKEQLKKQNSKEKIQESDEKVKPQNKRLKKADANQSELEKKLKTNKETPKINKEKEQLKKQNSKEKIQKSDEKVKPQNNRLKKADTSQSKPEKIKQPDINSKKSTTQNKNEAQINENKPHNKNSDTNNKQQSNKTQNKKKNQKADSTQLDTTVNNKKNNKKSNSCKNMNAKTSDSIIYEDSFAENNNNISTRPVRSCRSSKLNVTHDTSKLSNTLSRSLRSRDVSISINNDYGKTKTVAKNSKKTKPTKCEQSISDLSFSLAHDKLPKKPLSSLHNSTLLKTKEIDTSVISFTLTNDKDSPITKIIRGNSAKSDITQFFNRAVITLTPLPKSSLHMKDSSIVQRPPRNRMANRRYVS